LRETLLTSISDPRDRPTALRLLDHPFCFNDPDYNFFDTELWEKIKPNFIGKGQQQQQPAQQLPPPPPRNATSSAAAPTTASAMQGNTGQVGVVV
jgi:hypothetical protein